MSVNKVILLGRLGKEPELTYTPSGSAVCKFSLATTEKYKGKDGNKHENTTWHNIVVWGKQAEILKEYLAKGRELYIEGRIDNRSYESKGEKKYITEIVVEDFTLIGGRVGAKADEYTPAPKNEELPLTERVANPDSNEDLPF